jgi:hypothetical protein
VSFSKKEGETAGRTVYQRRRWRLPFTSFEIDFTSDLIAHDYMRRWKLEFYRGRRSLGGVRLHHIMRGDDRSAFHDHPMNFKSIILKGGYIEYTPDHEPRRFVPGDVVVKKAEDLHYLELIDTSAWTLVFAGPFRRDWGFMTDEGWIPASAFDKWKERYRARNVKMVTNKWESR